MHVATTAAPDAPADAPRGAGREVDTRLGHRPGLDALRGVAVASIVAYHADPGWFPLAPMSLDVFFVLSTFLVTKMLLQSLAHRGGADGRRFFTRRLRRLGPGLVVMVGAVVALGALGAFTSPELSRTAVGALGLHANVAQFGGDYFSAFAERNPLEHTWSLSVEEHFYLVTFASVALLWWVTRRDHRRTRVALCVFALVAAVASVLTARHLLAVGAGPNRVYMGTDTRAVAGAAGVALAAALWGRWDLRARSGRVVTAVAVALTAAALGAMVLGWRPTLEWYASGGWALTALAAAAIVAAASRAGTAGRVSGNPVLQWAGRRSYGIYLWHLPLIVGMGALVESWSGWVALAAVAATALAAEASHRLVESRYRGTSPSDRRFVPATVAAVAAIAVLAFAAPTPHRPEWAQPIGDRSEEPPPVVPAPAVAGETATATTPTATPAPPPIPVVVWGDATAGLVATQLGADGRFAVTSEVHDCDDAGECTGLTPSPVAAGTAALVVAVGATDPFHAPITNEWDVTAPERAAIAVRDRLAAAAAGVPVVVAMAPEARRDLGVGLHLRRLVSDDPANLVLGAEPERWPDALADRLAPAAIGGTTPTKVLLVGDSVAYSLATAFRPAGTVVWDQSRHGCDPAPGDRVSAREGRVREPAACDWRAEWSRAVATWDPDVVVWHTGTWSSYDRHVGGAHLRAGTPEWHDALTAAHAEALALLAAGGAEVAVVVHAPAWETARGKPVETTPEESAWRMPAVLDVVRAAAGAPGVETTSVTVLDAAEAVCTPSCDTAERRDDGVHYTPEGARIVSDWLTERLVQAGGLPPVRPA